MKKYLPALVLALLLSACGGEQVPSGSPAPSAADQSADQVALAILDAASFSETLEPVERDVALALYGLEDADVLDCAAYLSTGATAEECAVFIMTDDATAQTALEGFQTRVADQLEALADYQPAEIAKLEKATYGTRAVAGGTLVYLVVAQDVEGISEAISA